MKLISRFAPALFAACVLAPLGTAQLDLPDRKADPEKRGGVDLPRAPRGDAAPKDPGQRPVGGLDVPGGIRAPKQSSEVAPIAKPGEGLPVAEEIFAALRREKRAESTLVKTSVERLVALGPEGLAAARTELAGDKPAALMAAARTLIQGGLPYDRVQVQARLAQRLPNRATGPLVDLVLDSEPPATVLAVTVDLLDSRSSGVRRRAMERLKGREIGPPVLFELKADREADVREFAFTRLGQLGPAAVSNLGGPDVLHTELLLGMADKSTKVSLAATAALAGRIGSRGDTLVHDLVALYRTEQDAAHRGGLALLALVDAEERLAQPLVPEDDVLFLLIKLRQGDPFERAVTATALAGVGFRSNEPVPWLDQEVTQALIEGLAGGVYYPEHAALQPLAMTRLERLTGQHFGSEGPLWTSWWAQHRDGFQAVRAVLAVAPEEHGLLDVRWVDPGAGNAFRLIGAEVTEETVGFPGPVVRLAPIDSVGLLQALAKSGAFGADRLPGLQGRASGAEPQLTVRVGERSKSFRLGVGPATEWAAPVRAKLDELFEINRWQLFPLPERALPEGVDFFTSESKWWHASHTPAERNARLAALILANMPSYDPLDRGPHVAALEGLPAGTLGAEHFEALADRFSEEVFLGERARAILALAMEAGRDGAEHLSDDEAGRLLDVLVIQGGAGRQALLTEVAEAARPDFARELAEDPRADLRAVAARALAAGEPDDADRARLSRLMVDASAEVEAATVLAVSEAKLDVFRDAVQSRARVADSIVRLAAIRGTGLLGGPNAVDILRLVVLDRDMQVKAAGVDALAELADPRATTLLAQMFASGDTGPFYASARRGLLRIGEPAWDDLLTMANTSSHPASRPAMLLLAEQGVTEVMTTMLTVLTTNPSDSVMARELAVLTGVDYSMEEDPSREWWIWHDQHREETALAWFVAAANEWVTTNGALDFLARGHDFQLADLAGDGTERGAEVLIEFLRLAPESHLERRALRELRRLFDQATLELAPVGRMRTDWCDVLLTRIDVIFEAKRVRREAAEKLNPPAPEPVEEGAPEPGSGA